MTIDELARKYVELIQAGDRETCLSTLFDTTAISEEAFVPPGRSQVVQGLDALRGKSRFFFENNEVHRTTLEGPFVNGSRFIVRFHFELTFKPTAQQRVIDEMGLFEVVEGRIIRETFFAVS